jgi:hypothetical protein
MRAARAEREGAARYPIRGIFAGCCASAGTATANSITATRIDNRAAFFIATSFWSRLITKTVVAKSVIYGRRGTRFVEGEKAKIGPELNCTTLECETIRAGG